MHVIVTRHLHSTNIPAASEPNKSPSSHGGSITSPSLAVFNSDLTVHHYCQVVACWFRGSVVERWSLTGELSLSCARPTADGRQLMWENRPL